MIEINETIEWNNYVFQIYNDEFEDDVINIKLKDKSLPHDFFAFTLKIKSLSTRGDDAFEIGDYYQEVMNKETMVEVDRKVSYASLTHDFLLENAERFVFLKNIYSSSLTPNEYEPWTPSISSRNFWDMQLKKNPSVPVSFIEEIQRFRLKVND